jgi:hypothetical protein
MKTISARKVTRMAMVAGGEKRISKIVYNGRLWEWVGIGWIDRGQSSPADRRKYPVVRK